MSMRADELSAVSQLPSVEESQGSNPAPVSNAQEHNKHSDDSTDSKKTAGEVMLDGELRKLRKFRMIWKRSIGQLSMRRATFFF